MGYVIKVRRRSYYLRNITTCQLQDEFRIQGGIKLTFSYQVPAIVK
jgi:hypothetical protein